MTMGNPLTARLEVVREFPPLGSKYRVRLLRDPRRKGERPLLDIREYVSGGTGTGSFEGYTRRGITLASREDLDLLREILKEILDLNL
jgi:hypothetical protein